MSRRVPTLCSVHLRRCRTGQSTRRREGDGVVRGRRLQVAANERAELNLPRVMPSGSAIIIVTHAHLMPNPRSIRLARSVLTDLGGDEGRIAPDRNSGANARRRHCSPGLHDLSLEKEPPGGKESGSTREEFDVFLLFLPYGGINILLLRQEVSTAREAEAAEGRGAGAVVSELP